MPEIYSHLYVTPETVELGSVVELTRGSGTSEIWDIGAGRKKKESGSGGGSGPFVDKNNGG